MRRSLERRLTPLEQAMAPPDVWPLITIEVYDGTPDRVVRRVTVPMGPPSGELDYRKALWMLHPGDEDEGDDDATRPAP